MRLPILALAMSVVYGIFPGAAQSQESRTWLAGRAGVAAPVEDNGDAAAALSLVLSHERGGHVFSLRAAGAA